jgi:hypothetical protein
MGTKFYEKKVQEEDKENFPRKNFSHFLLGASYYAVSE